MTLNEFKRFASEQRSLDYDGQYGAQCVDLIRVYLDKVFGVKPSEQPRPGLYAKDWYLNFDKTPGLCSNFEKIPNLKDTIPQAGDIVIWNAHDKNGGCGHIAIVLEGANVKELPVLEQNYVPFKVGLRTDNYYNCLGFLRRKV